jgi:threonine/homoserine/homoserine lactone efflux protein
MGDWLFGLGVGFLVAVQVGPVTLLMIRSILRGALATGLAMTLAVALVDTLYATVGLAGPARLLRGETFSLVLGLAGGAVLVVIGVRTLWLGFRARTGAETDVDVSTLRRAFVTALAATALNPLTIGLWTLSFPAAVPHGVAGSPSRTLLVLVGVMCGALGWYTSLSTGVALAKRRLGPKLVRAIDLGAGAGLVAFGGLLGYRAVHDH